MNFGLKEIGARTVRGNATIARISSCTSHIWVDVASLSHRPSSVGQSKSIEKSMLPMQTVGSRQCRESRSFGQNWIKGYDMYDIIKIDPILMSRNNAITLNSLLPYDRFKLGK